MQHTLQTDAARFGASRAFAALADLGAIQAKASRDRLTTAVLAGVAFGVAFCAVAFF